MAEETKKDEPGTLRISVGFQPSTFKGWSKIIVGKEKKKEVNLGYYRQ